MYKVVFSKTAKKDAKKLKLTGLEVKAKKLIDVIRNDPFLPPYEKLVGNLSGAYSRRINSQHRLVYTIDKDERFVKVHKMWSHYE